MKKLNHYLKFALPVIATVAMLFSSCSSGLKGKEAQVPKDAYFVANVNLGKLWKNADMKNIDDLQCYPMLEGFLSQMPKVEKFVMDLLNDPSTSGINTDNDILVFASKSDNSVMVAITASLKDKEKFTEFLNTLNDLAEAKIPVDDEDDSDDGLVYATLDKDAVLAYSEKGVALVIATDHKGRKLKSDYAASLFAMDEDESLSADSQFQSYWNDRTEMGVYVSIQNLLKDKDFMRSIRSGISEEQLKDLQGTSFYYTLAFETGRIKMQSKALGTSESAKSVLGKGLDNTLLKYMPGQTLAAASLSLNLKSLVKYAEKNDGVRRSLNEKVEGTNYTIKDLITAFGGNAVASFYGMKDEMPLFAIAVDVANANLAREMLTSANMIQKGDFYYPTGKDIPGCLYFDGKTLAYTNDPDAANTYANGGYSNGLGQVAAKAKKGNYFYMDLNIRDYPEALLNILGIRYDSEMQPLFDMLRDLEIVGNADNSSTLTINLNDKRNSLAAIIRLIDQIAMNEMNRPRYYDSYDEVAEEWD